MESPIPTTQTPRSKPVSSTRGARLVFKPDWEALEPAQRAYLIDLVDTPARSAFLRARDFYDAMWAIVTPPKAKKKPRWDKLVAKVAEKDQAPKSVAALRLANKKAMEKRQRWSATRKAGYLKYKARLISQARLSDETPESGHDVSHNHGDHGHEGMGGIQELLGGLPGVTEILGEHIEPEDQEKQRDNHNS